MENKEFKYSLNLAIPDSYDYKLFFNSVNEYFKKIEGGEIEIEHIQTNSLIHEFEFRFNELIQLLILGIFYGKKIQI